MSVEVNGSMLGAFAQACLNYKILLSENLAKIITIEPPHIMSNKWFPVSVYEKLCYEVSRVYTNPNPILEKVGEEIVTLWLSLGTGKIHVNSAEGFLRFQAESKGYYSVVRGPKDDIGEFKLVYLDKDKGVALISSTTPLNKSVEVGILRGGLKFFESSVYVDVVASHSNQYFLVEYH